VIRADFIRHSANRGKADRILAFVRRYRACAAAIAAAEWRTFFTTGKFGGKYANVSRFNAFSGAAPAQMARAQVATMLASFIANRQNEFRGAVSRSSLPPSVKHMLHTINAQRAWYIRADVAMASGGLIPADVRRLARIIMRAILKRHRKPNTRGIAPVLDVRAARVASTTAAAHGDLWTTFKFVGEKPFAIPLHTHARWRARKGKRCNVIQIVPEGTAFSVRLMTDMSAPCADSRAQYEPRCERVGVDFGLSTLIATDRGDLMGRGFLDCMRRIDRQLLGIARHRVRAGGKPRDSRRYRTLIARTRGIIKTRLNTALNRIIEIHAPREVVVERLDFSMPGLSPRLNRLLANCGRAAFRRKLQDLKDKFGIKPAKINAAYTSQECSACGFVARENRKSQSEFCCGHCGHTAHADVDAAKVIARRRSLGLDFRFATKRQVFNALMRRFVERHDRAPRHRPADRAECARAPPFREEKRLSFIPETKVNNCRNFSQAEVKRIVQANSQSWDHPSDQTKD
jgi:putative transposase